MALDNLQLEWRRPWPMPPLDKFDKPCFHVRHPRTALGETIYDGSRAHYMAGFALKPDFFEFTTMLRSETLTPIECSFIQEFVHQLPLSDF